tara:strand:+ start:7715 stop:9310 length:1596 start_codon:yes stop_codon:yes gene_type:complete
MNKELFELDRLFKSSKFEEVISKTQKLIKSKNAIPPYYNLRGISLDNIGKSHKAVKNFQDAIEKNPNEISYYSNISKILIKQGNLEKAEYFLSRAIKIKSDDTYSLFEFGKLKRLQKQLYKALGYFKKVYNINSKFPNVLFMLGKCYLEISQETNEKKYKVLAEKTLLNCSNLYPENVDADFLLSEIFDYNQEKKHQKVMLNKINNINFNNSRQKSAILFSISKSYEDQKKYDQASEFLNMANNEMNNSINKNLMFKYSKRFENLKLLFDKIINIKSFDDENLYSKQIICIVGMPRSGTTLLHQLIASAKDVEGIGESSIIPSFFESNIFSKDFFTKINKNNKFDKNYLIEMSNLLGDNFNKIKTTNKNTIVDKNPSNFFWIGFIKLLFPNAKIIHIKRNLKDTCLSVYKNIFGIDEMDWSYSQKNIIEYVKIYLKVINYWKNKYENFIYEIDYENLINNKILETKKLFNFCNLDWSDDIFNYYKTGKIIRTASLYQVRKPIYKTSVNISKNYLNYLTFLKDLDQLNLIRN